MLLSRLLCTRWASVQLDRVQSEAWWVKCSWSAAQVFTFDDWAAHRSASRYGRHLKDLVT